MCMTYIPPGNRRFKPKKRNTKQTHATSKKRSRNKKRTKQQATLAECFGFDNFKDALSEAIEASGDALQAKDERNV
jgi:hypothetical protein